MKRIFYRFNDEIFIDYEAILDNAKVMKMNNIDKNLVKYVRNQLRNRLTSRINQYN